MKENLEVIAERIADMREIMNISAEEMAMATGMSVEEYLEYESGKKDFSFSFLYTVARYAGDLDITDLSDRRERQAVHVSPACRAGEGLVLKRSQGI